MKTEKEIRVEIERLRLKRVKDKEKGNFNESDKILFSGMIGILEWVLK